MLTAESTDGQSFHGNTIMHLLKSVKTEGQKFHTNDHRVFFMEYLLIDFPSFFLCVQKLDKNYCSDNCFTNISLQF